MKIETLKKNFQEMLRHQNKLVNEKFERLIKSGALNIEEYGEDYELPKMLMHVICKEISEGWIPFTDRGKRDAKNLEHF